MIEVTVKTLDAQNHHFTVPSEYTVEQLKEHIAETIQIPSEAQRCIYLGQILQNDMKLADCDVNGKVIHVVQRPPPSAAYGNNDTPNANNSNNGNANGSTPGRRFEHTGTMYLGAMAFPSGVGDLMDGGLAFLHPRTNLSVSRLVVARNLLRRAVNVINQLENENYFSSNQEQANQAQPRSGTSNMAEDMNNSVNGSGLEQHDVEIRIELPSAQPDATTENVGTDDGVEMPDPILPNGISSADQTPIDDPAAETSTNNQTETENNPSSGANRDETNRRRSSRTPMMATVMGAVLHAQVRLIPFMRLLRQYLLQDTAFGPEVPTTHTEQQIQFLYNSVSQLMHYFAHIYHSLSDIMCDFSQPPPRTLRCRPVILQQQHATVLRGTPRGRIIRSPVLAVSRSTSTAPSSDHETSNSSATRPPGNGHSQSEETSRNATAPTVEVVIEEADTTNMHENHEEVIAENMDVSEPVGIEIPINESNNGAPGVTVRGRSGNTYVIQSMPEGLMPEGIRINSMEATILTPNDDITAALSNGANQRWRAGIVPAEVLHNMFGLINQFRHSQRGPRSGANDRTRQSSTPGGNTTESTTASNNNTNNATNGENNQPQNERSIELDITAVSRTFDPFLPCHSHHIHPILSRASSLRNASAARNANNQSSSSNQSTQSSQTQQSTAQATAPEQGQSSRENNIESANEDANAPGAEGSFNLPEMPRNLTSLFSNLFPGFNIGNVMLRRGSADANNAQNESAEGRSSGRARIQLSSNMNTIFPGAIHIEIDPLTNNIQTNIVPNPAMNQTESDGGQARTTSRRRRAQTARRTRRVNSVGNGINNDQRPLLSPSSSASTSSASSSPPLSPSISSSSSDDESLERPSKVENKENSNETTSNRTLKHFFSMIKKEDVRYSTSKAASESVKNDTTNKFPLYVEDQEASFLDVFKSITNNASFKEIVRGGDADINELTSSIRQRIRWFLIEHRNIINGDKNSLLNAVNILINNDLHKMKNLLDSDCVKQEIDLVSTICKFNHDSVPELIEHVTSGDLSDNEFRKFCKRFHFYVARLLTLFVHCISGDDKSVQIKKVLGAVVEELIKGLPKDEDFERWLRKDLINHVILYSKISQPDNLPAFMRHYVVYRLPPVMPVECTVATATITNFKDTDAPGQQPQPMEVEDAVQSSSSSESSFMSASSEIAPVSSEQTANASAANENNAQSSSVSVVPSAEQLPEVVLNSEEWHRTFPSEWVPIITRDIHRLRRQGSQPPFSDAYLSGMPTKRRKLIKKSKPDIEESNELITDNISTSMSTAGFSASVNTITNHVTEQNTNEGNLTEIVKEELKENVRENIVQRSEFLPHRFPDSTKYFMDK